MAPQKSRGIFRRIIPIASLLGLGLAFGYGLGYLAKQQDIEILGSIIPFPAEGPKWVFLILLPVSLWLAIAFHELGHLLAGRWVGFRFVLYIAGVLGIRQQGKKTEVYFNRDWSTMGGLAATTPRTFTGEDLRPKFARVVAGGPLASLVLGGLLLTLAILIGPSGGYLLTLAGITGFASVLLFFATAIPMKNGNGFMSDGARLRSLLVPGPNSEREQALLSVTALLASGRRYGEFPAELIATIDQPIPDESKPPLGVLWLRFMHYLDAGLPDHAAAIAQELDERIPQAIAFLQQYYARDLYFFYTCIRPDAEKASAHWSLIQKTVRQAKTAADYRLLAAKALAEGDPGRSRELAQQGLELLKPSSFPGQDAVEQYWLRELLNREA